jgi:hypothetical protein
MDEQTAKMVVSGIMNDVAEFFDQDVEKLDAKAEGDLILWTVKFFAKERAIAGIIDMSLSAQDSKYQIAASVVIGLHPMGEAIGWFIYAQQLARAIPKTISEATSAMCYFLLSNMAKVIKPVSLKEMFLKEIQFDRLRQIIVDQGKKKVH